MDCIQHIGFANAVEARQAVEARREVKGLRRVTFKIGQFDLGEMHGAKFAIVFWFVVGDFWF